MSKSGQGRRSLQQRRCIVCRRSEHKSKLLRFVLSGDEQLVWDEAQVMSGRGAYLHPKVECWSAMAEPRKWCAALRLKGADSSKLGLAQLMDVVRVEVFRN